MFNLEGKRVLVTGATGGIGAAVSEALLSQGAKLVISGSRADILSDYSSRLGKQVFAVPCDLGDASSTENLCEQAYEILGGLDVFVHSAGIVKDNLVVRMKDTEWLEVQNINLNAGFRIARACLKPMMKARWGRIIFVTSVVGAMGNPGQANYAASKAGLTGMAKAMAAEVATRGVTVNCVAPGFIETAMTDKLSDKQRESVISAIPSAKIGTVADIAAGCVYLASEEASYVTGQTLHINGGMAMI